MRALAWMGVCVLTMENRVFFFFYHTFTVEMHQMHATNVKDVWDFRHWWWWHGGAAVATEPIYVNLNDFYSSSSRLICLLLTVSFHFFFSSSLLSSFLSLSLFISLFSEVTLFLQCLFELLLLCFSFHLWQTLHFSLALFSILCVCVCV